MKRFKKKHTKLPSQQAVVRLLSRTTPDGTLVRKYYEGFNRSPKILPEEIRQVSLAEFDPGKRTNIRYYPDLHNFQIYSVPNRSLPIPKFLELFRAFIDPTTLAKLEHDLTCYRLEFLKTAEEWIAAYADDSNFKTCMTGSEMVRCYCHPQNKLALAALYAPGTNSLIARTIVNTDEKWYVRLFGDPLLVSKLNEQGYHRLTTPPKEFRMYGEAVNARIPSIEVRYPYFDFACLTTHPIPDTYNPDSGLMDVIINQGITT